MAFLCNLAFTHLDSKVNWEINRCYFGICADYHRCSSVHYRDSAAAGNTDDRVWISARYAWPFLALDRKYNDLGIYSKSTRTTLDPLERSRVDGSCIAQPILNNNIAN